MKKLLFAILIAMAVTAELLAGAPAWNAGYVMLPDGQKLEGQLSYNWKVEVVQLRLANGLVKAWSAGHANSFVFFDELQQTIRRFSSVAIPGPAQEARPVFMEELSAGPLTVYRRLRHTHEFIRITRPSIYSDDSELLRDMDNFVYQVITPEGQVVDMTLFSRELWPRMITHQQQLADYIKSRSIDPSSTLARLLIITQYNYLSAAQPALSRAESGE